MKWLPVLTFLLLITVGTLLAERLGYVSLPGAVEDGSGEPPRCADGDLVAGPFDARPALSPYAPAHQLGLAETTDALPATPAGAALARGLRWMNLGIAAIADAEFQGSLSTSTLERTPLAELRTALDDVAALGPFAVVGFAEAPTATQLNAIALADSRQYVKIQVEVEATAPHRITVFHITPWTPTALNAAAGQLPAAPAFAAAAPPAPAEGSAAAPAIAP